MLIEEFVNTGDLSKADEFISPDYISRPSGARGPDGYRRLVTNPRTAFPDFRVKDIIVEGDLVAFRAIWTGTHQGELRSVPPTGKQVEWRATIFRRLRDGSWWRVGETRIC